MFPITMQFSWKSMSTGSSWPQTDANLLKNSSDQWKSVSPRRNHSWLSTQQVCLLMWSGGNSAGYWACVQYRAVWQAVREPRACKKQPLLSSLQPSSGWWGIYINNSNTLWREIYERGRVPTVCLKHRSCGARLPVMHTSSSSWSRPPEPVFCIRTRPQPPRLLESG